MPVIYETSEVSSDSDARSSSPNSDATTVSAKSSASVPNDGTFPPGEEPPAIPSSPPPPSRPLPPNENLYADEVRRPDLSRSVRFSHRFGCTFCGDTSHDKPNCPSARGRVECFYLFCKDKTSHAISICPALHERCGDCLARGHSESDHSSLSFSQARAWRAWERVADDGLFTRRRFVDFTWGWFPLPPGERNHLKCAKLEYITAIDEFFPTKPKQAARAILAYLQGDDSVFKPSRNLAACPRCPFSNE